MRTIVLIDNNNDTLQFMKEAIASIAEDIQCLSFIYAEEAIKAMMTGFVKKPSLMFINLNMPRRNGIQCLMEIRSNPRFNDLPVVFYAPKVTAEVTQVLSDAGVATAFEKPNTIVGWKKAMREMLNSVGNVDIKIEELLGESKKSMAVH